MKILWMSLLLLACGQPRAGPVYGAESSVHDLVLGLAQNSSGAYELQLCKSTTSAASECINPLVTADGEAYGFSSRGKSWMAQSLRWGAALLAGIIGGAVVFKAGRYIVRQQVAGDLGRVLHAEQVEKLLVGNGQELPGELRHAMQSARLNDRDARKLLTLLDQQRINIEQEADLLAKWDKHVVRLRDALQQGNMFVFKDTFDTSLTNLHAALRKLPASKQELVALDQLSEALRRNKLSKNQALRKLTSLESRVHKQVGKLLEEDWDKAMQQARQALERSKDFDGRPAVKKGQQVMRVPLNKLEEGKTVRRLSRLEKYGTRRAEEMKEEIQKVFDKIEAIRNRHLRAAGVRIETKSKLDHRDELLRVLQDLELVARNEKQDGRARKLKALARGIQNSKADQGEVAKRMHSIDRDWQLVKDSDSADAWRRGLGKVDAMLTDTRSINDYKQLHAALRELQHYLIEIGDKGNAKQIKKIEKKMAKRLKSKRSVSTRELDVSSEKAMEIVNRSRKHNKWKKTVAQLERGSEEMNSGLEDSNLVRPKHALQSSLNTLESVLQKLVAEDELVLLRKLRADIAAKRLSREELANNLAVLDDVLRQGKQATAFKHWQTDLTQVKAKLGSNSNLYELNPDFAGIWDEMTTTLQASKLRATFADEVKELQRYTLNGNWQEGALDNKLKQIDTKVRNTGSFRTADELLAVQGKERRVARKELRQRLAELRRELRVGGKTKAAPLDTALREGEKTRKAKQGSFSWFKYGEGGERVINRAQVLTALRDGDQLPAIEVRMGLEKLAAQLTGATIFVALPFMFDNDKPQSGQLVPLLQRMAQAVDAEITPTAQCWLGECVTTD